MPEAKWWASVNGMTRNGELCETQIKAESGAMLFNAKSSDETIRAYLKVLEFLFSDWATTIALSAARRASTGITMWKTTARKPRPCIS